MFLKTSGMFFDAQCTSAPAQRELPETLTQSHAKNTTGIVGKLLMLRREDATVPSSSIQLRRHTVPRWSTIPQCLNTKIIRWLGLGLRLYCFIYSITILHISLHSIIPSHCQQTIYRVQLVITRENWNTDDAKTSETLELSSTELSNSSIR